MTPAVIEAGPGTIRRLDVGAPDALDRGSREREMVAAALDALDDPVVLVGDRPLSVDALWGDLLRTSIGDQRSVVVVHPTGWAASRIARVRAAAGTVADDVITRNRSSLLASAAAGATVVVEIEARRVVISGGTVAAEPRTGDPARVAAAAARRIVSLASGGCAPIVLDAPSTVGGARALARMIAERLRAAGLDVELVDDNRLARLARHPKVPAPRVTASVPHRSSYRHWMWVATVLPVAVLWLAGGRPGTPSAPQAAVPTTFLVEGRVAVQVPAHWAVRRVTAGPGSARVVLTSPSNPQVALHVTQSPVLDDTLEDTAAAIQRALADQPPGIFVDFAPAAQAAGRPVVSYREVRPGHDIRWSIVLDGDVRISIGCQSPTDADGAVHEVCEQAVRSAHAVR